MIWIRADANKEIGMGHVMRCLSIAAALRQKGEDVKFILADESAVELLEGKGQAHEILHSTYTDMEEELPKLLSLMERQQPKLCIVDSYYVTATYLERMRNAVKTVYLDDIFSFPHPVDMVINYNIYGDLLPYHEQAVDSEVEFLLGTAYAPLRTEYCGLQKCSVRDQVKRVLITTGGSDKYNLAGQILEAVMSHSEIKGLEYHVVSGAFNANFPALQKLAEDNSCIKLHQNVVNMVELMQECDVAISAGGSTMYELCAVGVPIICFSFADNQERLVATFVQKKLVCYGGNYLKEKEQLAENVARNLIYLAENRTAREEYSRKEQEVVDGRGAERIAQALIEKL